MWLSGSWCRVVTKTRNTFCLSRYWYIAWTHGWCCLISYRKRYIESIDNMFIKKNRIELVNIHFICFFIWIFWQIHNNAQNYKLCFFHITLSSRWHYIIIRLVELIYKANVKKYEMHRKVFEQLGTHFHWSRDTTAPFNRRKMISPL